LGTVKDYCDYVLNINKHVGRDENYSAEDESVSVEVFMS